MGLKEILKGLKDMGGGEPKQQNLPDDVTTDKFLKSLRRQRRVQLEQIEKERLKKEIKSFQDKQDRENLFVRDSDNLLKNRFKKEKFIFKSAKPKKSKSMLNKGKLI